MKSKRKVNYKIITYSAIGLAGIALMYFVDWIFIIIPALMIYLNQKELNK